MQSERKKLGDLNSTLKFSSYKESRAFDHGFKSERKPVEK